MQDSTGYDVNRQTLWTRYNPDNSATGLELLYFAFFLQYLSCSVFL